MDRLWLRELEGKGEVTRNSESGMLAAYSCSTTLRREL